MRKLRSLQISPPGRSREEMDLSPIAGVENADGLIQKNPANNINMNASFVTVDPVALAAMRQIWSSWLSTTLMVVVKSTGERFLTGRDCAGFLFISG